MQWHGERSEVWQKKFALFPREVECGRKVVWLQNYWIRYIPGPMMCDRCKLSTSNLVVGHWETSSNPPPQK